MSYQLRCVARYLTVQSAVHISDESLRDWYKGGADFLNPPRPKPPLKMPRLRYRVDGIGHPTFRAAKKAAGWKAEL